MRATVLVLAFVLVSGAGRSQVLQRFPLDDGTQAGFGAVVDPAVKAEGSGSLRIITPGPSTICLGRLQLDGMKVEATTLVCRARLKSELEGTAYLEMWVTVDGKSYFSKGLPTAVTGSRNWTEVRAPFHLQKGQRAEKAVLDLVIEGKGTVWVDDIVVSKEPLPPARP